MSISSPQAGGNRRPSTKPAAAGGRATGGKEPTNDTSATEDRATGRRTTTAGNRPATGNRAGQGKTPGGKGGAKTPNRPPITPIKVNQGRNWGPIMLFSIVGVIAVAIIGFGAYVVYEHSLTWQDKADSINGIVDYRKTDKSLATPGQHAYGKIEYAQSPPVGGKHNPNWQRCMGDVYPDQIPNENAVHALEHGSVWITYRPDLPADQISKLAGKVKGNDFMLMSPYPGLDKPISLQAWGFQLKVDNANDPRIDAFIKDLRINASMEPGAVCSSGNYVTKTGTDPVDLGKNTNPTGAMG